MYTKKIKKIKRGYQCPIKKKYNKQKKRRGLESPSLAKFVNRKYVILYNSDIEIRNAFLMSNFPKG